MCGYTGLADQAVAAEYGVAARKETHNDHRVRPDIQILG
jgi:hypothetical protein